MLDALSAESLRAPAAVTSPCTVPTYAGKTLAERATGRFYTPDSLASDLAIQVAAGLSGRMDHLGPGRPVSLCDPFCGDGRLVVALMAVLAADPATAHRRYVITLRDLDGQAMRLAALTVTEVADRLRLVVEVRQRGGDSLADPAPGRHDAIITNPPWELLKPDSRETAGMGPEALAAYSAYLRARCAELDARFPDARASVSWAGWGTNLARCGWDLALRSCAPGGILGIVLPSTILADRASEPMRRSAVARSILLDLAAYPPEARLFAKVDQPVVAAVFRMRPCEAGQDVPSSARVRLFDHGCRLRAERALEWTEQALEACGFTIPVGFGAEAAGMLSSCLDGLPSFGDLEGKGTADLWAGRELDETRIASKLDPSGGRLFVKGRMVGRHSMAEMPTQRVADKLTCGLRSVQFERLAWRDVARGSMRRRMTCTLIPPGWVAGNSLHVAHFRDGDAVRLRALHAVVSSYVFEFQVRTGLGTGHMSLGFVRRARVPRLGRRGELHLARLVDAVLEHGEAVMGGELEAAVARAYGLCREQMEEVLLQFPKVDGAARDAVLASRLWIGKAA